MTVLVVLLVILMLVGAGAAAVARSAKTRFSAANEVVPGTTTTAPPEWAGAHTPEALLHRRLRDAVGALRAEPAMEDAWALETRVSLEQQALAVDARLITVAALPRGARAERMPAVAEAVGAVESAVASLADVAPGTARTGLDQAMAEVDRRMAVLDESPVQLEGGLPPLAQPGAG